MLNWFSPQETTSEDGISMSKPVPGEMADTASTQATGLRPPPDHERRNKLLTLLAPAIAASAGLLLNKRHPNAGAALGGLAQGFADTKFEQAMGLRKKKSDQEDFNLKEAKSTIAEISGMDLKSEAVKKALPAGMPERLEELVKKHYELLNDVKSPGVITPKEATELLSMYRPLTSAISSAKKASKNAESTASTIAEEEAKVAGKLSGRTNLFRETGSAMDMPSGVMGPPPGMRNDDVINSQARGDAADSMIQDFQRVMVPGPNGEMIPMTSRDAAMLGRTNIQQQGANQRNEANVQARREALTQRIKGTLDRVNQSARSSYLNGYLNALKGEGIDIVANPEAADRYWDAFEKTIPFQGKSSEGMTPFMLEKGTVDEGLTDTVKTKDFTKKGESYFRVKGEEGKYKVARGPDGTVIVTYPDGRTRRARVK